MNYNQVADFTPEVTGFYHTTQLKSAHPKELHTLWGEPRSVPQNKGRTMTMYRYANLADATTALEDGITPAGGKMTKTTLVAQLQQYGDYVIITDQVKLFSVDRNMTIAKQKQGKQMGKTRDSLARDVLVAGDNVRYANDDGTPTRGELNTAPAIDDLKYIQNYFLRNDAELIEKRMAGANKVGTVPIDEAFIVICHVDAEFDYAAIAGFVEVKDYPSHVKLLKGEFGSWKKFRFCSTSNAKVWAGSGSGTPGAMRATGGSADVYASIFMAADAYSNINLSGKGIESIQKPLGHGEDHLNQRASSGWKMLYVCKITNETWIYRLEHCCTDL